MYKVIDKFLHCFVVCANFKVNLDEASQEQLEYLYQIGHQGVVLDKKKTKKLVEKSNDEEA
jgi:hypothetical protein